MKIICDRCEQLNKGRYRTFDLEVKKGKKKMVTWCYDCLGLPFGKGKTDKKLFDELSIPFWKMMGQKPKPKDVQLERYLKHRGMSYGDMRRERDARLAKHPSAIKQFEKHVKKYGRKSEPDSTLRKTN